MGSDFILQNCDADFFISNKLKVRRYLNQQIKSFPTIALLDNHPTKDSLNLIERTPLTRGIGVFLSENKMKRHKMLYAMADQESKSVIVDRNFILLPRSIQRFTIWHEIGHIVLDLFYYGSPRQINKARLGCVKRGVACSVETEADQFAQSMVGRTTTIQTMQFFINQEQTDTSRIEWVLRYKKTRENYT